MYTCIYIHILIYLYIAASSIFFVARIVNCQCRFPIHTLDKLYPDFAPFPVSLLHRTSCKVFRLCSEQIRCIHIYKHICVYI